MRRKPQKRQVVDIWTALVTGPWSETGRPNPYVHISVVPSAIGASLPRITVGELSRRGKMITREFMDAPIAETPDTERSFRLATCRGTANMSWQRTRLITAEHDLPYTSATDLDEVAIKISVGERRWVMHLQLCRNVNQLLHTQIRLEGAPWEHSTRYL